MRVDYAPAAPRWMGLKAEPIDFDGLPPVPSLKVDWPHESTSPDRVAVAGALAFSLWTAGCIEFQTAISALTAQRIVEWFAADHVWVAPCPVRTGGLPLPRGSRHARLVLGEMDDSASEALMIAMVGPSKGTAIRAQQVNLASNVGFFAQPDDPTPAMLAALAAVVLCAEHLHLNTLSFPQLSTGCPELFDRAARLLECVSLGLTR